MSLSNKLFNVDDNSSELLKLNSNVGRFYSKNDLSLSLKCSKQRSVLPLIYLKIQEGIKKFTVSSSGNSALVAIYAALQCNYIDELRVFLSKNISENKIQDINSRSGLNVNRSNDVQLFNNIRLEFCDNPKQRSIQSTNEGFYNIRGSNDDLAKIGFQSIAFELIEQMPEVDRVFVPSSSGTTACGIYEGFRLLAKAPEIHIVQTSKVHTLIDSDYTHENKHPAEAIVDLIGHRKAEINRIISNTGGMGWVVSSEECNQAFKELLSLIPEITFDSALAYAALKKYLSAHPEHKDQANVVLFTG